MNSATNTQETDDVQTEIGASKKSRYKATDALGLFHPADIIEPLGDILERPNG